jgi:hypothetical protein
MVSEDKLSIGRQLRQIQSLSRMPMKVGSRKASGSFRKKGGTTVVRPFINTEVLIKGLFLFLELIKFTK